MPRSKHSDWAPPLGSLPEGPLGGDRRTATLPSSRSSPPSASAPFVDTAPFNGWGRAEEIVGEAIRDLSTRPPVLTKCGTVPGDNGRSREDHSRDAIRADVDASRTRLGVEILDAVRSTTPIRDADRGDVGDVDGACRRMAPSPSPACRTTRSSRWSGRCRSVRSGSSSSSTRCSCGTPRPMECSTGAPTTTFRSSPGRRWPAASSSTASTSRRPTPPTCGVGCAGHDRARSHRTRSIGPADRRRPTRRHDGCGCPRLGHPAVPVSMRSSGRGTPAEAELLGRPLRQLTDEDSDLLDQAGIA